MADTEGFEVIETPFKVMEKEYKSRVKGESILMSYGFNFYSVEGGKFLKKDQAWIASEKLQHPNPVINQMSIEHEKREIEETEKLLPQKEKPAVDRKESNDNGGISQASAVSEAYREKAHKIVMNEAKRKYGKKLFNEWKDWITTPIKGTAGLSPTMGLEEVRETTINKTAIGIGILAVVGGILLSLFGFRTIKTQEIKSDFF